MLTCLPGVPFCSVMVNEICCYEVQARSGRKTCRAVRFVTGLVLVEMEMASQGDMYCPSHGHPILRDSKSISWNSCPTYGGVPCGFIENSFP